MDCWEHTIAKPSNQLLEYLTFSGKAKANTLKTLAIIDKYGYFRYVKTGIHGRINDRDAWTSCAIFLNRGQYLTPEEKIAADGGFTGIGPTLISYDVCDTEEKRIYNAAFTEVRKGVECAFNRIQRWFPITGVNKAYWNYDHRLLSLAINASTRLHNWLMRTRGLEYNAENNPYNHYRDMY
jgi:hypothetical protein